MARFRECMILIPPLAEWWVYWNTLVCLSVRPSVRPSLNLVYVTSHLSFVGFYSYLVLGWPWSEHVHIIPISRMVDFCESYSPFHVCLTICPSTHLVYATSHLSHFIHIWYLDWPWSQHAHIMPISRMVDFCESYSPFHVCLTIRPSAHLVYATSHLSFVGFYSYLVSWLAMIWAGAYYTDFTDGWFLWEL
jgi:hypothetical protein